MNSARLSNSRTDSIVGPLMIRAGILLATLLGSKIFLLILDRKNLYQDHWRWSGQKVNAASWISFFVFQALLLVSFVGLGRKSSQLPLRHIRILNAGFVFAGLTIAMLSLNNGDDNHLEPYLRGLLPFSSLYSYWNLAFFFGKPWIAAYCIAYGLAYFFFWRNKVEWRSLYVLGFLAVLYFSFNFSHLLHDRRSLLIIDCFGIASLASTVLNKQQRMSFILQCVPAACLAVTWLLLRSFNESIESPHPYLMIIVGFGLLFFLLPGIPLKLSTASTTLSHWLPFFFVSFLLLPNQGYPLAGNYNKLMVYGFAFPAYIFSETVIVSLLACIVWWISRLSRCRILWLFDIIAVGLILSAVTDIKLEQTISSRLDWNVLTQCDSLGLLLRTLQPYWAECLVGISVVAVFYTIVIIAARRLCHRWRPEDFSLCRRWVYFPTLLIVAGLLSSGMVSHDKAEGFALSNILRTSPLLSGITSSRLTLDEFSKLATDLHLRPLPLETPKEPEQKKNLLLVVLESTYNKHLSLFGADDETQPLLKKYKGRMEIFPNFYSTFPSSLQARFTILSGLYPTRTPVSHVNPHINSKSIIELLHDEGYVTSVYQSDPREYLRFSDYLANRGLDSHYDSGNMPGKDRFPSVSWGVPEQATMEAMTNRFSDVAAAKKPFFMTYFPVAPHMPYDTPLKGFEKFPSKIAPFVKMDYSGEYKNTLLYIDWILSSLIEALEKNGLLDETLVVITNDHGEMIGDEDGKLGHGWCLRPDLCATPLIILNPSRKEYQVNYTLGSQVDLLPTIASLLNVKLPNDEFYEGNSLYDPAASSQKIVYFNSASERALIRNGHFYREQSPGASPEVYKIKFEDTRTVFEKTEAKENVTSILDDFERFQTSLISHYQFYKKENYKQAMPQMSARVNPTMAIDKPIDKK
ncbi:MAG: hypothetical protein JWM68_601 [Verrucomicrobiales bacterium]|nr:hypothetical protein [Verrucomicrobiales bacterium]